MAKAASFAYVTQLLKILHFSKEANAAGKSCYKASFLENTATKARVYPTWHLNCRGSQCWKVTQNVAFELSNFGISHLFY